MKLVRRGNAKVKQHAQPQEGSVAGFALGHPQSNFYQISLLARLRSRLPRSNTTTNLQSTGSHKHGKAEGGNGPGEETLKRKANESSLRSCTGKRSWSFPSYMSWMSARARRRENGSFVPFWNYHLQPYRKLAASRDTSQGPPKKQ